jgi:hypothetical protein
MWPQYTQIDGSGTFWAQGEHIGQIVSIQNVTSILPENWAHSKDMVNLIIDHIWMTFWAYSECNQHFAHRQSVIALAGDILNMSDFWPLGTLWLQSSKHSKCAWPLTAGFGWHRGEGYWKPVITSWVHCEFWFIKLGMFLPITFWTHLKCSQQFQVEHMLWVYLDHIWNVISTCFQHVITDNI